ncbi:MAG: alkane 1-monooxygenase, partial [Pseudomonadota bacterium]
TDATPSQTAPLQALSRLALAAHAAAYLAAFGFTPALAAAMVWGGPWIGGALLYAFLAAPTIDALTTHDTRNLDPRTPDRALIWHKLVTWAWAPVQLALLVGLLAAVGAGHLSGLEQAGLALAVGVATGGVGITFAHELMHRKSPSERALAEALMCSTLYGHFCIEHVYGHHRTVATPEDPATARAEESFYAFLPRTLIGGLRSAWAIETARLRRRGRALWSPANAFWRFGAWALAWGALAWALAGWAGLGAFALQAAAAVALLEMVNYLEHWGLTRARLADGRYEPTRPHHSWNANHRFTNRLLINLQRHSDHHYKPDRRFPLLQSYSEAEAPQLPYGYAWMVLLTLVPPLWFRVMTPRLEAWRARFYPEETRA